MELDALKQQLRDYVQQYSISKFDAEDIVELVSEGESIDWIVDQLQSDAQIDVEKITSLLTEIRTQLGVKEGPAKDESIEPAIDLDIPIEVPEDLSQLDLSQIGQMLPEGMQLPPGIGAKEIKDLIESPQGQIMTDFVAYCQERGIDVSSGNLSESKIAGLEKEWMSTPRDSFDGKTPSDMLAITGGKVETVRRENQHVGRNDPCPCGIGKKYKKCCGRA